jgi:DNA-binding transcriptional LysR family regulator
MEIRQIETFLAVLDLSSVTRAAEAVGLSPGAVSMQIHQLADELSTDLFVKSGRGLAPTPAALQLAGRAHALMEQVRLIHRDFRTDPANDRRPFHLATGATTLIHRLGKPLRLLRTRYPDNEIRVTVSATEETVKGLLERRFDLGLISLPFENKGLTIIPLFDEELLGLRPSSQRVRSSSISVVRASELSKAPFLLYPKRSNMRTIIDRFFREIGVTPKVILEADDTEAIKRLVESGFGWSVLPQFALRGPMKFYQPFRVAGSRLIRRQALAMVSTEHPRALTESIAEFLRTSLAKQ